MNQSDTAIFVITSLVALWNSLRRREWNRNYAEFVQNLYKIGSALTDKTKSDRRKDAFASQRREFFRGVYESCGLKHRGVKVVHVAGTKGKGSTCSYIAAALHAQGLRVGVFTSPHLHTVRERIKIGRSLISAADFVRIAKKAVQLMERLAWPLFFDVSLCMALLYFGEQRVDYIVLETGIGGEYDSTNFIQEPAVSVITNIGLDHQNMLGDTIVDIAGHKAGIIKPGRPVFTTSNHPPEVMDVFRAKAAAENAELRIVACDASVPIRLGLSVEYYTQIENICVSAAVLEYLGVSGAGMRDFYWPCRMERFVVRGVDFIVDGNHNDESLRLFLDGVRKLHPVSTIVVIFGCGTDKNLALMIAELEARVDAVVLAQSNHFKSSTHAHLIGAASNHPKLLDKLIVPRRGPTLGHTLDWLVDSIRNGEVPGQNHIVVTCGSLFIASESREWIYKRAPENFCSDDWVQEADGF